LAELMVTLKTGARAAALAAPAFAAHPRYDDPCGDAQGAPHDREPAPFMRETPCAS